LGPISCDESLENEIRTLLRLRLKHPAHSPETRSYRQAIKDRTSRLKALRLARQANRDSSLPPVRKKHFYRGTGDMDSPAQGPSTSN
jgi:hypothetical protein